MRSRGPARNPGWGLAAFGLGIVGCAGPPAGGDSSDRLSPDTGGGVSIVATSDLVSVASTAAEEGYATLAVHDSTGRVAVGWHDGTQTLGTLYDAQTLQVVAELRPAFAPPNPNHPQLLAVPDGFWFVAPTAGPLMVQRFDVSGEVSGTPVVLAEGASRPRDPDLTVTPDGQVHLVWTQVDTAWRGTVGLDPTGPVVPVRLVEPEVGRLASPPTVRAGTRDVVLAWSLFDLDRYEVFARSLSSEPIDVAVAQGEVAYRAGRATVAVDEDGGFVVGWREVEAFGLGGGVFMRAFDEDGVPRTPAPVALDGSGTGNWVTSAWQDDTLVFAWSEGPVGETTIWLQPWSLSRAAATGPPVAMSSSDGAHRPYVDLYARAGEVWGVLSWESPQPGTVLANDVWLQAFRVDP